MLHELQIASNALQYFLFEKIKQHQAYTILFCFLDLYFRSKMLVDRAKRSDTTAGNFFYICNYYECIV